MRKRKFSAVFVLFSLTLVVFGMMVTGCEEDSEDKKAPDIPSFSLQRDFNGGIKVIATSANATRYAIWYSGTSERDPGAYEVVFPNDVGNGVYLFTGLVPNKTYYFWVSAGNSYGNSGIAGPKSAEATVW